MRALIAISSSAGTPAPAAIPSSSLDEVGPVALEPLRDAGAAPASSPGSTPAASCSSRR